MNQPMAIDMLVYEEALLGLDGSTEYPETTYAFLIDETIHTVKLKQAGSNVSFLQYIDAENSGPWPPEFSVVHCEPEYDPVIILDHQYILASTASYILKYTNKGVSRNLLTLKSKIVHQVTQH